MILSKIKSALIKVMILPLSLLASCDYLDVVPPEQVTSKDTMKDRESALGFLYSCYISVVSTLPYAYNTWEASTDEYTNSLMWEERGQRLAWNLLTASGNNTGGHWSECYNFIGHSNLFLRILDGATPRGATEEDMTRWRAEIKFLKAYYHFRLLEEFGPIPIMDEYPSQNIRPEEMPGRSHYDYVVSYITRLCDEAAEVLKPYYGDEEWGRVTSTACKALKARALLYAASELWNGGFPHRNWKNVNYETPGYGKELVSTTYSQKKWEDALVACQDALKFALDEGDRALMQIEDARIMANRLNVPLPYVPGVDPDTPDGKEFLERVLLMRFSQHSYETDGNKEYVFATYDGDANWQSAFPTRIIKNVNTDDWIHGWGGMAPTLYTVEHFYTKNGKLPEYDEEFCPKEDWLKSANIQDRPEIINLNVNREPRFYACISFDGDDYSSMIVNGEPLRLNLRSSQMQGYDPDTYNRDWGTTGYLTKKFCQPNFRFDKSGNSNNIAHPFAIFRLPELYLNLAECYAALGDVDGVIESIRPLRERAGVPSLKAKDITEDMTLMDWVRNERFIELWGEGNRYYDVRRWMIAPQQLKAGAREGLNALVKDPSFDEFNKRVVIDQPFQWDTRMYMLPIGTGEIYTDPQLVQAPGY